MNIETMINISIFVFLAPVFLVVVCDMLKDYGFPPAPTRFESTWVFDKELGAIMTSHKLDGVEQIPQKEKISDCN